MTSSSIGGYTVFENRTRPKTDNIRRIGEKKRGFDRVLPKGHYNIYTGRSCQSSFFFFSYNPLSDGSSKGYRTSFIDCNNDNAHFIVYDGGAGFHCGTGITCSTAGHLVPLFFSTLDRCPESSDPEGRTFVAANVETYSCTRIF